MPPNHPGLNSIEYWIVGAIGAAVLFTSVLLHELTHSIIATRYGLKVGQIVLFIFGGVSHIEEEEEITKDFRKEFKIAVVGPVTSFVLAAVFASVWRGILLLQANSNGNGKGSDMAARGLNVSIAMAEAFLFYNLQPLDFIMVIQG
jgi:Zn-dependent protease